MNSDAERLNAGFAPVGKANVRLCDYIDKVANECLERSGNKHGYFYSLMALKKHLITFKGDGVRLHDVDDEYVKGFVKYLDVPLEVVAKQLGHGKITTTMIYAKIMGKTQSAAVNKQNDLFRDAL